MTERHELSALRQLAVEIVQRDAALVVDFDESNASASRFGGEPPWQEIRGVLRYRQQDLITTSQLRVSPRCRNQIDAFGGTPSPHDFRRCGGVDERCQHASRVLVPLVR